MIEIQGMCKSYGDHVALDDLTLTVESGELLVYLGPNGAGKTTTLRILAGLLGPCAGRACVAGFDPLRGGPALRRRVGYLSDDFAPYEFLTGREYLEFVADVHSVERKGRAARIAQLLELLDLADAGARLTREYSHGMLKKLGLAAALVHEPRVLLLDEPTSELDPRSTRLVHDVLRGLADRGCCVLVSTHLLERAESHGDRVGILSRGRLVMCGPPADLTADRRAVRHVGPPPTWWLARGARCPDHDRDRRGASPRPLVAGQRPSLRRPGVGRGAAGAPVLHEVPCGVFGGHGPGDRCADDRRLPLPRADRRRSARTPAGARRARWLASPLDGPDALAGAVRVAPA